jgi:hypothetical protein
MEHDASIASRAIHAPVRRVDARRAVAARTPATADAESAAPVVAPARHAPASQPVADINGL